MQIDPIELLALNLAAAAACEHAKRSGRVEAAQAIGVIVGQHDVSDIPGWPHAACQRSSAKFDALRGRRTWDIVMAMSVLVTRLGGSETMTDDRMTVDEKAMAKAGRHDDAIGALVARRKIRHEAAAEIVDWWAP